MNKNLVAGLIAVGLIISGGTGFYFTHAKANSNDPVVFMSQQRMGPAQMTQMMNSTNGGAMKKLMQNDNISFNQMLPSMKKMHPNLNDKQLKALYEEMAGADGSQSCNVQGKMKDTSGSKD